MTSSERASRSGDRAEHLLKFLAAFQGARQPGAVLQAFCRAHGLSRTDGEVALSVLLNQGKVVVTREMELEPHFEGHAVAAE